MDAAVARFAGIICTGVFVVAPEESSPDAEAIHAGVTCGASTPIIALTISRWKDATINWMA
jgi:hypothetical protein